jgi:hypothetical protein
MWNCLYLLAQHGQAFTSLPLFDLDFTKAKPVTLTLHLMGKNTLVGRLAAPTPNGFVVWEIALSDLAR